MTSLDLSLQNYIPITGIESIKMCSFSSKPSTGSTFSTKRIGRGQGSGYGGTSTKGHKGQKARAGYSQKIGFEGGQMPLQRRLPKFGFNNVNRKEYRAINLDTIQALADAKNITDLTKDVLVENGLAKNSEIVKIMGRGELKSGVSISANKFTKSAEDAISKAGGKAITL